MRELTASELDAVGGGSFKDNVIQVNLVEAKSTAVAKNILTINSLAAASSEVKDVNSNNVNISSH